MIVGGIVAVVALGVIGFLGYTKIKADSTTSASTVAPARPAMMSPSAAAYVTEDGDDENPTVPTAGKPSGRKARKLSF